MSNARRLLRQTLTVARRDFIATVVTPTFLIFLLAPVIMISLSLVGSFGARSAVGAGENKLRLVVIAPAAQAPMIAATDKQLRTLFVGKDDRPPLLRIDAPTADPTTQARTLFSAKDVDVAAVLYGPLDHPQILYGPRGWVSSNYLAQLAEQVLRVERIGPVAAPLSQPVKTQVARAQSSFSGRGQVAFFGVFGLFFLTLMLAGQSVGTMAEEKSNKVIEILAAAVPLESVFLGKLLGMFGVALLFVGFWTTLLLTFFQKLPPDTLRALSDLSPAVGNPAYPLLFFAYFAMSYMLQGAVFLSVGSQAATQREIQMLALPITIFQVAMFGFASAGAASQGTWVALAAEIFPFSSPLAMIGHAANSPDLWPHFLALGWQALWVAITITVGARLFRRGVLKSGSPKFRLKALFAR